MKPRNINIDLVSTQPLNRDSGSRVRDFNIYHSLSKYYSIKFISPKREILNSSLLRKMVSFIFTGLPPYISDLRKKDLNLLINHKSDIIQLEQLDSFFLTESYFEKLKKRGSKIVLDEHNIDYIRLKAELDKSNLLKRFLGYLILRNFKNEEIRALKKVDHIFACSEVDKNYFTKYVPKDKVTVVPNGVDCDYFKPTNITKENNILFMGLLSYAPNEDSLKYYFGKIHNSVKKQVKDVKIFIIGKDPPKWLEKLSKKDNNIVITGFVEDVRDYIKNARVCICPLRYGSGTRLKILEYMASGKPVVSTSIGAEGIKVINKKNIFLADTPKEFSKGIINLLKDYKLSRKIGYEGRKFVENNYDWEKIIKEIVNFYNNLFRGEIK